MPAPKKAYGQNFIINPGICPKMVLAAGIDAHFGVLEIGPGLGALTREIARCAGKVLAIEIDGSLLPQLRDNLAEFDNVEILHGDAMQMDIGALIRTHFDGMPVAVMGNLPYYITSPLLMKLLEERVPAISVTAMVQREAAVRLCAVPGSRESGAVTLAVQYYSEPRRLFDVAPGSFFPPPKVTSSVIHLALRAQPTVSPRDERFFFAVIKAAFAQRRKTAANAISAGLGRDKAVVAAALEACGIDPAIRPERMTLAQFAALSDRLEESEAAK